MSVDAILERSIAPLDQARRLWFALILRSHVLGSLFTRRDRRVVTLAVLHACVAFVLSVFAPVVLFVLGPVLLGVVHVAADVRYLVLRQELAKWWRTAVWILCGTLVLVRALWEAEVPGNLARIETLIVLCWVLLAISAGARQSRAYARATIAAAVLVLLGSLSLIYPLQTRLVFAQLHNLVALVLWALLFRDRLRLLFVPVLLTVTAATVLVSGAFYQVSLGFGASAFNLHILEASEWLAPGLRADYAVGLVSAYVFLQSIHYAIWLLFIPQQQTAAQGTLTFKMSVRSLLNDFGPLSVIAMGLTALLVLFAACFDVLRTRSLYLSLAMFHAYLELVFLAYFWVRGKPSELSVATPVTNFATR